MEKIVKIEGMTCMHCVSFATEALQSVEGVKSVQVSLEDNQATVEVDSTIPEDTMNKALKDSLTNIGFEVPSVQ